MRRDAPDFPVTNQPAPAARAMKCWQLSTVLKSTCYLFEWRIKGSWPRCRHTDAARLMARNPAEHQVHAHTVAVVRPGMAEKDSIGGGGRNLLNVTNADVEQDIQSQEQEM